MYLFFSFRYDRTFAKRYIHNVTVLYFKCFRSVSLLQYVLIVVIIIVVVVELKLKLELELKLELGLYFYFYFHSIMIFTTFSLNQFLFVTTTCQT